MTVLTSNWTARPAIPTRKWEDPRLRNYIGEEGLLKSTAAPLSLLNQHFKLCEICGIGHEPKGFKKSGERRSGSFPQHIIGRAVDGCGSYLKPSTNEPIR